MTPYVEVGNISERDLGFKYFQIRLDDERPFDPEAFDSEVKRLRRFEGDSVVSFKFFIVGLVIYIFPNGTVHNEVFNVLASNLRLRREELKCGGSGKVYLDFVPLGSPKRQIQEFSTTLIPLGLSVNVLNEYKYGKLNEKLGEWFEIE